MNLGRGEVSRQVDRNEGQMMGDSCADSDQPKEKCVEEEARNTDCWAGLADLCILPSDAHLFIPI